MSGKEGGQTGILDPEEEECFRGEAWCCVNISSDVTTEGKIPAAESARSVLIRENALSV